MIVRQGNILKKKYAYGIMMPPLLSCLEPVVFQFYLVFRLYLLPFWYRILHMFMRDRMEYSVVVGQEHGCTQHVLTPESYMDLSVTPLPREYFLLVHRVSYLPDRVVTRYLVVQRSAFAILPGQSLQQSTDQVKLIRRTYGSPAVVSAGAAFLGGECTQGSAKQCVDMDQWCVKGNVLFFRLFRTWLWCHHLNRRLVPGITVDVSLIDQDINELHLGEYDCIEITSDGYKRLSKTI
jgi:hypothetical protein